MKFKLTLAISVLFLLAACKQEAPQQSHWGGPVSAKVQPVETRMVTEWQEFTGRFKAKQRVEIRARVGGYLAEIKFTDGQFINKGDVLFVIDQRPFLIALKSAKASYDLALWEFNRAKNLRATNAISEEGFEQRNQELLIAEAKLAEAKLNVEFTEVKAPFAGRLSRNLVDIGAVISGGSVNGTLLTTLVSTSPIEFYFEGSEADLLAYIRARENGLAPKNHLAPHPVFIKLQDESHFAHEGTINFMDNELSEDTGTIQTRATFNNDQGLFEPGMFARLRAAWNEPASKVVIPQHVIGTELTRKYVYTLDENNIARRSYITLGGLTEDGMQIITDGLPEDARIITSRLQMLQPGSQVIPASAEDAGEQGAY